MKKSKSSEWHGAILTIRITYIAGLVALLIFFRAFWTPDIMFVLLLGLFTLWGQGWQFIKKFLPFVVLLLSYESLRGFATHVNSHVHYTMMANFDRDIFGRLPTAWLQQHFYHGHLAWYDFYFYFLYMMHFVVPVALAIYLWKKKPKYYAQFLTALLLLSYGGFITYLLYPAAPPWMAAQLHLIEPIHRISSDVWGAMGVRNFPTIYHQFAPNEVAAVPSLHAAYPFLIWLFAMKIWKSRWTWALLLYPISIWVGVVYLGEHYVFDVILGIAYAIFAYLVTIKLFQKYEKPYHSLYTWLRTKMKTT